MDHDDIPSVTQSGVANSPELRDCSCFGGNSGRGGRCRKSLVGADPTLLLFLSVVMFVALAAGPGPAALASVLTFLSLQYPLLSPGYPFILQSGNILRLGLFIVASALAVLLSAGRNKTLASLQRLHNDQQMIRDLQEQNDRLRAENAEHGEAATSARRAEQEIRLTVDTVPALIARYRADGFMDFRNKNWREYTGLSQDNSEGPAGAARCIPMMRRWSSASGENISRQGSHSSWSNACEKPMESTGGTGFVAYRCVTRPVR